jgi:hypothetical protein
MRQGSLSVPAISEYDPELADIGPFPCSDHRFLLGRMGETIILFRRRAIPRRSSPYRIAFDGIDEQERCHLAPSYVNREPSREMTVEWAELGDGRCAETHTVKAELVTKGPVEAYQSYLEGEVFNPERHA